MRVCFHRTLQLNRLFALRSYPSSVGYAATFSPGGEGSCYSSKVSLCVYILGLSAYSARQPLPSFFAPKNGHKKRPAPQAGPSLGWNQCLQTWLPTVQLVLHALWQEVWHSPQPPVLRVFWSFWALIVLICLDIGHTPFVNLLILPTYYSTPPEY